MMLVQQIKKDGRSVILSNNHVLANSNAAEIGDPVLQPGPHDGGRYPEDHIADLEQFVPINIIGVPSDCPTATGIASFLNKIARLLGSSVQLQAIDQQATENLVDAAIARPLNPEDVKNEILQNGACPLFFGRKWGLPWVRGTFAAVEDVLEVYARPYDLNFTVVCMDESSAQLIEEVHAPIPASPGHSELKDDEYVRKGVASIFMEVEPLGGKRTAYGV
ncbi:MAG: hypothetical protein JRE64_10480 [Deltaproteobacteria bacterium]|nr:hypothetical protein [Deltaproteobacteria bacterium]